MIYQFKDAEVRDFIAVWSEKEQARSNIDAAIAVAEIENFDVFFPKSILSSPY